MKKKVVLFQILYYFFVPVFYIGCLLLLGWILKLTKKSDFPNLGAVIAATNIFVFLVTPCYIAFAMRFSLLKWYVDPIAAAGIPLWFYISMVINVMGRTKNLFEAIHELNFGLNNDGGEGWFFFGALFLFGLLTSFSIARKEGHSISYRLLKNYI